MKYINKETAWHILLLLVRLWLGRTMIRGGQSILRFFSDKNLRDFFENWFGNEMGFPAPLLMAFIAKSVEFICGILVVAGLSTRISAAAIAVVMFVATIADNINFSGIGEIILPDGRITISSFLFAFLLVLKGAGWLSVDNFLSKNKV